MTGLNKVITFDVFHFDISGKDNNNEHPLNIYSILIISDVFHFDISDKDNNDE